MTNEWTPFSLTSILWEESGRMVWPFSCQMRSGVGRPLTYVLKKKKSQIKCFQYNLSHIICAIKCQLQCNRPFKVFSNLKLVCVCVCLCGVYMRVVLMGNESVHNAWDRFSTIHIPEKHNTCLTCSCASVRPPLNVPVCLCLCMCLCVFSAWGWEGWTEMLVYPSAFIVMFLRRTHCSSAVPLGVYIPCVMLTMSIMHHYSQLECVHDFYWKNRLWKVKKQKTQKKGTLILDLLNCI